MIHLRIGLSDDGQHARLPLFETNVAPQIHPSAAVVVNDFLAPSRNGATPRAPSILETRNLKFAFSLRLGVFVRQEKND